MYSIKRRTLYGIYLILPALLVLSIFDYLVLDRSLLEILPRDPNELLLWALIFNTPHIISSFITLSTKEYVAKEGRNTVYFILALVPISLAVTLYLPSLLNSVGVFYFQLAVFVVYALFTMNHVVSQQYGLVLLYAKCKPNAFFIASKILAVVIAILVYAAVLNTNSLDYLLSERSIEKGYFEFALLILLGSFLLLSLICYVNFKQGRGLLAANTAMVLSTAILFFMGYDLFVLMIPRFIHDLSAFYIYIRHDQARQTNKGDNYIYNLIKVNPLLIPVVLPVLGIILTQSIHAVFTIHVFTVLLVVDFLHYKVESRVWKNNGINRKHLIVQ